MSMTVERIPSTLLGNLGLQPHYELVVVGTSLSESIVAAAASATGTSVLHLDANDYYGGLDDATFRFDDIVQWAQQLEASQENDNIKSRMEEGELVEGELLHTIATALATARMTEETCSEGEVDEGSGVNETDGERAELQALDPEAVKSEATKLRPRLRLHRLNTVPTQAVRLISYTKEDKISGETDTNSKDVTPEDIAASAAPAAPVALSTTKQVDDGTEIAENTTEQTVEDTKSPLVSLETLRAKSRYFCLDLMPRAVLCAGGLVELMISSGVGRYLDFLSMEAICILEEEGKRRRLEKRTGRATQGSSHLAGPENGETSPPYHIWQVPCSKSDIFSSKELPRTEKLVLMKFLRFCLDWGTKHVEGSTVEAQDDRQLTNTRALNRPQSLSSSGGDLRASGSGGSKSAEVLANEFLEVGEGQSFADFLALWKLPARLQHAVIYAIAMLPVDAMKISAQEGLEAIFAHLSSLGQYGETAFLTAMYGTSEIAQAFCRLCAVGCGTYVLRQCPYAAVLLADNTDAREDGDVSSPSNRDGMEVVGVCDRSGGLVSCSRLVCASDYCPATTKGSFQQWTVRRIVVLDRPARDDAGRFIAVFNPRTVGIGNQGPIYAIHLDESANVVPSNLGVCVLHLTMSFCASTTEGSMLDEELKNEAGLALQRASAALANKTGAKELWHVAFAVPCAEGASDKSRASPSASQSFSLRQVRGAAICERQSYELEPSRALKEARGIFDDLFPGNRFLERNEEERAMEARMRGETEDADQEALEVALQKHLEMRVAALEIANLQCDSRVKVAMKRVLQATADELQHY